MPDLRLSIDRPNSRKDFFGHKNRSMLSAGTAYGDSHIRPLRSLIQGKPLRQKRCDRRYKVANVFMIS